MYEHEASCTVSRRRYAILCESECRYVHGVLLRFPFYVELILLLYDKKRVGPSNQKSKRHFTILGRLATQGERMDAEELGMQQALLRKGSNRNTAAGGLEEAISRRCACASQSIEEGGGGNTGNQLGREGRGYTSQSRKRSVRG